MTPDEAPVIEPAAPEPEPSPSDQRLELASRNAEVEREMHRISRRSFMWGGVAALGAFTGWRWLVTRRDDDGVVWPLRRVLEINEQVARDYFQPSRLAPTFSPAVAKEPRVNGDEGMSEEFDPSAWKLRVEGLATLPENASNVDTDSDPPALLLTLKEIRALPRVEMVTELKCIEGWSVMVRWAGARFADFAARYGPTTQSGDPPDVRRKPDDLVNYVSMVTPDDGYYVGLDMASALHPQTLLCYEMNGQPLALEHGAPLRLVIPVKYGIKNIKRIGTIKFTNERPVDFWAEQGYDWYAGH
jgi:hypothetical protein